MIFASIRTGSLAALALLLVACEREAPERPATPETPSADPAVPAPRPTVPGPPRAPATAPAPPGAAAPAPALDRGALDERKDPDRLLRFYAAALAAREWRLAAGAWGKGSGVTASTLKAAYDRAEPPLLDLGKGVVEGAAGSLYYEAPVVLHFGDAAPEHGSLVLRRVNDVPGATAEQLRWHIERSTIGQGQ